MLMYSIMHKKLVVVTIDGPALLERDLLRKIRLDWPQVNCVQSNVSALSSLFLIKEIPNSILERFLD